MQDALPVLITPCPFTALRAEHEYHDDIDYWYEGEEGYPRTVENAPEPAKTKGSPVPVQNLRRHDGRRALPRRVAHRGSWRSMTNGARRYGEAHIGSRYHFFLKRNPSRLERLGDGSGGCGC